jgi:hypothetical protein
VTRGKADIFDGIVPAGQLPTPTPPLFSEVVNVVAPANGVVNLSQHNFKTIKLDITTLEDLPTLSLTLPLYCVVIFGYPDTTNGSLDLILGTSFNGIAGLKFPNGYDIEDGVCSSGKMTFSIISPGLFSQNTILRMNFFISLSQAIEL